MARWLQVVSDALPLTYAYDALARATRGGPYGGRFALDVARHGRRDARRARPRRATLRRRTG